MTLQKLLREPLVHFLGIGLLLFLLYALVAPSGGSGESITISRETIAAMKAQQEKLWGRPPTDAELSSQIDARVDEEILYREGLAMGLDRDDAVVKRRIRQKYDLIAEEADSAAPTDADLEAYLKANPEKFRSIPIVTFRQLLLAPGAGTTEKAEAARRALQGGASPDTVGTSTLLPTRVERVALDLVARDFGGEFAQSLSALPTGSWQGPVQSGFGAHLVWLEERTAPPPAALADVRPAVQREWENDRRLKARDARLAELRKRYDIVIEKAQ